MQIEWDQDRCCHAGVCVGALPQVFKIVDGRFVIDTTQAVTEDIEKVVGQCPSGALWIADSNSRGQS